jgi:hypothetical protein
VNDHRLTAGGFGLRLKAVLIGDAADVRTAKEELHISTSALVPLKTFPEMPTNGKTAKNTILRLKATGLPIPYRGL